MIQLLDKLQSLNPQILGTIITGFVTVIGWLVLNFLNKRKENQTKLLQLKLEYISRQIEDLYGPLFSIVNQLNMYYNVKESIVNKIDINNPNRERINGFMRENYFYPLHLEARSLIKNKYHLIDDNTLPDSFQMYLNHSTQETLQIDIWRKLDIDTSIVRGIEYPDQFDLDAKQKLDDLKKTYNELLLRLK